MKAQAIYSTALICSYLSVPAMSFSIGHSFIAHVSCLLTFQCGFSIVMSIIGPAIAAASSACCTPVHTRLCFPPPLLSTSFPLCVARCKQNIPSSKVEKELLTEKNRLRCRSRHSGWSVFYSKCQFISS